MIDYIDDKEFSTKSPETLRPSMRELFKLTQWVYVTGEVISNVTNKLLMSP